MNDVRVDALEDQLTGLSALYENLFAELIATHPNRDALLKRLDAMEANCRASPGNEMIASVAGIERLRARSLAVLAERGLR